MRADRHALRFGTGPRIFQSTGVGIETERPVLCRREADTRAMRQSCHGIVMLITLFQKYARAVGNPRLHAGDEVAFTAEPAARSVIVALILERVIHVHAGAIGVHVIRADPATPPKIAIRNLGVDALDVLRIEAGFVLNGVDYFDARTSIVDSRKS